MNAAEAHLTTEFFPTDREAFRKHYPADGKGKTLTRQEHIDKARASIFVCNNGYRATDEEIFEIKPWLANDYEFGKYQAMEPFDRFRMMTLGLPWTDEVIEALKRDDGVRR